MTKAPDTMCLGLFACRENAVILSELCESKDLRIFGVRTALLVRRSLHALRLVGMTWRFSVAECFCFHAQWMQLPGVGWK